MLLETLREYANRRLAQRGELVVARERHARLFAARVAAASSNRASTALLSRALPDIEAALAWLIANDHAAGLAMAVDLAEAWRGSGQSGMIVARLTGYTRDAQPGHDTSLARLKALVGAAHIHCFDLDAAHVLLAEALEGFTSHPVRDDAAINDVELQMFWLAHERATHDDRAYMQDVSARWEIEWRSGATLSVGTIFALAIALTKQRRLDDAAHLLEGALTTAAHDTERATVLHAFCEVRWQQGLYRDVLAWASETCKQFQLARDRRSLPIAHSFRGLASLALDDVQTALDAFETALTLAEADGNDFLIHLMLHHRAMARAAGGDPRLALRGFETALAWASATAHTALVAQCQLGIAAIHADAGELRMAARHCAAGFAAIDQQLIQLAPYDRAKYDALRDRLIHALGHERYASYARSAN
jgi:tetratricopeptide (TPR) repeat protein